MSHIVAPSFLASDFSKIGETVSMINSSEAEWFHVDVMDGHFVPNLTFGPPIVKSISAQCTKVVDVHLMISNPEVYINDYINAGAQVLTVHYEACDHLHRQIAAIKNAGAMAGVALNPHTPVHLLKDIIADLDVVCLMSVNPGFGGQSFIENTYVKVMEAKELITMQHSSALIEIDGGVSMKNADLLVKAGADVLVAGSSVFKSSDAEAMISELKSAY